MRKVLNTFLAVLLLSAISFPTVSFADDNESETDSSEIEQHLTEPHELESDEVEHRHNRIEEIYEDFSGVVIPPVVFKLGQPTDPNSSVLPIVPLEGMVEPQTSLNQMPALEPAGPAGAETKAGFDPYKLAPLPVTNIVLTRSTPADEFMAGARIFGYGLGLSALALLGVTGTNAIRRRIRKSSHLNSSEQ